MLAGKKIEPNELKSPEFHEISFRDELSSDGIPSPELPSRGVPNDDEKCKSRIALRLREISAKVEFNPAYILNPLM